MVLSRDAMKAGTDRFYAAMNSHDVDAVLDLMADGVVDHQLPPDMPNGKDGVRTFFSMMFAAVPDMNFEILDLIVSGNKAAVRSRVTGTQSGEFMGMPATDKAFDVEGIDIVVVDDDEKMTEHWGIFDSMQMMMQTGHMPAPG